MEGCVETHIAQIFPDPLLVEYNLDIKFVQPFARANTGQEEQLRCVDRTRTYDHLFLGGSSEAPGVLGTKPELNTCSSQL